MLRDTIFDSVAFRGDGDGAGAPCFGTEPRFLDRGDQGLQAPTPPPSPLRGAEQLRAPCPTEFTDPDPGPRCKCDCASIAQIRACRVAKLAQGVRQPSSGMERAPPSSHGTPCFLSAQRVLPVPAGRAPMPPAPHRLPAGWPVPRSKSQPAGRLEGLLRRGGRPRIGPIRARPRPGKGSGPRRRSAGPSGRSCTPVRKILHAWSSGAGAQRQGTSGRPPKRPACLTCSKNSAKHGRRSPAGG